MAIIRSYTHPSNAHEVGVYHTLTGKINNTLVVPRNKRNRNDFPNTGAVVSYFSPPRPMPASVTIPGPIGHDGVIYTGTYAGFLGAAARPDGAEAARRGATTRRRTVWTCSTDVDAIATASPAWAAEAARGPRSAAQCDAASEARRAWTSFASRRFAC